MNGIWNQNARPIGSWKSCFAIVAPLILLILYGLLVPHVRGPRPRKDNAVERMRQIANAMLEYEQSYKAFPPAYTVDAAGNKLHSWRTLLLPYLGFGDYGDLFMKIDLSKPWDAPENATARATSVTVYEPYGINLPAGQTLHHVINHPQGIFNAQTQTRGSDVTDSQTLMVVQTAKTQATHWMQPDEFNLQDLQRITAANASGDKGQTNVAYTDSHVSGIRIQDLTPDQITGLVTIAGNEPPIPALNQSHQSHVLIQQH